MSILSVFEDPKTGKIIVLEYSSVDGKLCRQVGRARRKPKHGKRTRQVRRADKARSKRVDLT